MYLSVNSDRGNIFTSISIPISERESLKVECDHIATHFRCFDITEATLDDGKHYISKKL